MSIASLRPRSRLRSRVKRRIARLAFLLAIACGAVAVWGDLAMLGTFVASLAAYGSLTLLVWETGR